MSNTRSFAEVELDILSKSCTDPDDRPLVEPFREQILALCEAFGNSGQSGGSAPYVATALSQVIKHLLLQEPICPIMGIDEEWMDVSNVGGKNGNILYQNRRCSALFKDEKGVWYLDAIIWKGDTEGESGNDWDTFSGKVEEIQSRQFIKEFPFTPKTFYIDCTREILPDNWNEEPFYENKYYNTKIFEETGVKVWEVEKYRYMIKDRNQLNKVWKYYRKPIE